MAVYKATSEGVIQLTGQELDDWNEIDRLATENAPIKKAEEHRFTRDALLTNSDWTQISDSPLTDVQKASWAIYRQALRDITAHSNWPDLADDDWPTKP
jgi:hypothetical protein